jgi:hypothetical protein
MRKPVRRQYPRYRHLNTEKIQKVKEEHSQYRHRDSDSNIKETQKNKEVKNSQHNYSSKDLKKDIYSSVVRVFVAKVFISACNIFMLIFLYFKDYILHFLSLLFGNGNGNGNGK